MHKLFFLSLLAAAITSTAQAKPTCIGDAITTSTPSGTSSLHKLFFHVYDVEYWSNDGQWSTDAAHALRLTYFVSFGKDDLLERTIDELRRNPSVTDTMISDYKSVLNTVYRDINDGDALTAYYTPNGDTVFCYNDKPTGSMNAELAAPFMGIWLSQYTSEPSIRKDLLAGGK